MSFKHEPTSIDCPRCGTAKLNRETEVTRKLYAESLNCPACWFQDIVDFQNGTAAYPIRLTAPPR